MGFFLKTFLKLADNWQQLLNLFPCIALELALECVPGDLRSVLCGILNLNFLLHFFKVFHIT